MYELGIIREFKTQNFTVIVDAVEDDLPLDDSWDDTGTVKKKIESGEFVLFCARARVFFDGNEIASDYLGSCIYESYDSFQDHQACGKHQRELRKKHPRKHKGVIVGSYFSGMVKTVCEEARTYIQGMKLPYIRN